MIEKRRGASPQRTCRAEGNPGPEKPKTVTSRSVTWRCLGQHPPFGHQLGRLPSPEHASEKIRSSKRLELYIFQNFEETTRIPKKLRKPRDAIFENNPLIKQTPFRHSECTFLRESRFTTLRAFCAFFLYFLCTTNKKTKFSKKRILGVGVGPELVVKNFSLGGG